MIIRKKILLILLLNFFLNLVLSPLHAQADSLLMAYQTAQTPKNKLDALNQLANFYVFDKPDAIKAKHYAQLLLADAQKQADTFRLMGAYNLLGSIKKNEGKPAESFPFYDTAVSLARQTRNYESEAIFLKNISLCHDDLGNIAAEYEALEAALEATRKCECPLGKVSVLSGIAAVYTELLRDDEEGLFWLKETDKYAALLPSRNKRLGCLNTYNMAYIYFRQGKIDSAIVYNKAALACAEFTSFSLVLVLCHNLTSDIALLQQNPEKAIASAQKAYGIAKETIITSMSLWSLNSLVAALLATNQRAAAQKYLSETEEILKEYPSLTAIPLDAEKAYNNLFKAYLTTDPQRAVGYLEKLKTLQDSINQQVIKNRAAVFAAQGGIALKEAENKVLKAEADKQKQRSLFLLISAIALMFFSTILYISYRNIKRKGIELKRLNELTETQNEKLSNANRKLENFSHTLSHDALGYIYNILNFSEIGKEATDKESAQMAIQKIHLNAFSLNKMAQNLIQYNVIKRTFTPQICSINDIVEEISGEIAPNLKQKNASLIIQPNVPLVFADRELTKQVFRNIIGNALKFGKPDTPLSINVSHRIQNEFVEVQIADNGIGIPHEKQAIIFTEFTKVNKHSEGSGLGLYICKEILEDMGGTIRLESTEGIGSTFLFTLPLG